MDSAESGLKVLLGEWVEAVRTKDLDRLVALYAPDAVYFDLVPPLRFVGSAAIRAHFQRWFDTWKSSIDVEIREQTLLMSGDVAAAYMLYRVSGVLKDGREVGYWVRVTVCCRRSDQRWSIAHEHVSLPVDFRSGSVVTGLVP